MRLLPSFSAVFLVLAGCTTKPPVTPPPAEPAPTGITTEPAPASQDPFAVTGDLQREKLPKSLSFPLRTIQLGATPGAADALPKSCQAYVKRAATQAQCSSAEESFQQLESALAETRADQRDALLAGVESCASLPVGLVRALRAELAPVECGDALTRPLVNSPPAGIDGAVYDTLAGIALGARLRRTVNTPPKPKPPLDKANLKKFISQEMGSWARNQALAVEALAAAGSRLRYYGRAIVALEAGMADLRFIDALRTLPAPNEFKGDSELENAYFGNLEASLDPRKKRGRDATLVGLGQLASIGVIRDPRVNRARQALARMYGGRPIDALNKLMLPPLASRKPTTTNQRLAARLPSFYAGMLLPTDKVAMPGLLRQLIEKGVPPQHRIALAQAKLADDSASLYARARLELAQTYWRSVDIDEMLRLLAAMPAEKRTADTKLFLALGLALQGGPANAAAMMVSTPLSELGIGNTAALDNLAKGEGQHAAMAAFNSALIAELAAPVNANAAYWKGVAARYRLAAERMDDALDKRKALKLADDADQTATAIGQ